MEVSMTDTTTRGAGPAERARHAGEDGPAPERRRRMSASKRRVLRLMQEHDLLAPSRVGRPHGPRAHDGTIRTERVDDMWGPT